MFVYVVCCGCQQGFKITKQGNFMFRFGWEQTKTSTPAVETYQTAYMDVDSAPAFGNNAPSSLVEDELLFKRVVNIFFLNSHIVKKNSVGAEEDTQITGPWKKDMSVCFLLPFL
ncbi:hypothetical protein B296_00011310 [Ensete ventricosum]|uniref:Uncharacterized protein n=1 Tax=Ensete ventricosum TaxID=4639 RepID=A0A427AMP1_ENSVE|nr:hypothetical protein B296_00011310 [Ensete ventricosum]